MYQPASLYFAQEVGFLSLNYNIICTYNAQVAMQSVGKVCGCECEGVCYKLESQYFFLLCKEVTFITW
jgi:hypothetical protein